MWQAKELQEGVFGCVANKRVTGEILEVWQGKELAEFWEKVGRACAGFGRTARRASPGEARRMQKTHISVWLVSEASRATLRASR